MKLTVKLFVLGLFFILLALLFFYQFSHFAVLDTSKGFKVYRIVLADTQEKREKGLMFTPSLPKSHGMLFIYADAPSKPRRIWMKNTLFALDITFFDATGNVVTYISAEPCRADPCPIYTLQGSASLVLETNQGHAQHFKRLVFYH